MRQISLRGFYPTDEPRTQAQVLRSADYIRLSNCYYKYLDTIEHLLSIYGLLTDAYEFLGIFDSKGVYEAT